MTRKTTFFEGWSWFRFNNLGLAIGTTFKFYTSVAKGLKLKVRKFCGLIPTEKLVGGPFRLPPLILNRVNSSIKPMRKNFSRIGAPLETLTKLTTKFNDLLILQKQIRTKPYQHVILWGTWYHLYDLKKVKNTLEETLLVKVRACN